MEQQVIQAYQEVFGRAPDPEGLAYWTNTLNQNPDYNLRRALQNSPEFARQTYQAVLGREPTEEEIQSYLDTGGDGEKLRVDLINSSENLRPTQLGEIGAPNGIPLDIREDRPSTADLAYALTTGAELILPEYQVAGLDPMTTGAFEEFQANKGAYEPLLNMGVGALGDALSGTFDLAGQISGEVQAGQDAAGRAAEESYLAGQGAQEVASDVTEQARGLFDPLEQSLSESTLGARDTVSSAQQAADLAAERARMSTAEAQAALQAASEFGLGAAQQGIAGLAGTGAMYTPDMIAPYMNNYEDAAIQQALADISRQGQLEEQRVRGQAVQAGAFGGSRQAVAERELARNVLEQQGRTAAQMRAQGYESAAQRSQQAFEDALRRQQQGAQLSGQLGQMGASSASSAAQAGGQLGLSAEQLAQGSALQGGQLGLSADQMAAANAQSLAQTGLGIEQLAGQLGLNAGQLAGQMAGQAGNLGLSSANLGISGIQTGLSAMQQAAGMGQQAANMAGQAQQYGLQDLSTSMQMGQMSQAQQQAELDAQRLNEYQQAMLPYQQLAFQADIIGGAPTGITSTMSQPIQTPSMLSQIGGLGLTALSLAKGF